MDREALFSFDIFALIVAIGAIQGFFCTAVALFSKKGGRLTNLFFALLIGSISISIGTFVLYRAGISRYIPWVMKLSDTLQFLFGPALFLYVREITAIRSKNRAQDSLHFMPALGVMLFSLPFFLAGYEEQVRVMELYFSKPAGLGESVFELLSTFHVLGYILASMQLLTAYRKRLRESFSSLEKINLEWLKTFLIGMTVVYSIFIPIHLGMFFGIDTVIFTIMTTMTGSIAVYYLAFLYLKYLNSFSRSIELVKAEEERPQAKKEGGKYSSSPLTEDDMESYWQRLESLMREDRLFLQQELSLSGLAEKMDIPRQYLSQIINERAGVNFYDFINSYRVEEFIRLISLPENRNYTILAVAFDAGFNSKASFNTFFKKDKGMTPSQYIKEVGDSR